MTLRPFPYPVQAEPCPMQVRENWGFLVIGDDPERVRVDIRPEALDFPAASRSVMAASLRAIRRLHGDVELSDALRFILAIGGEA